MLNNSFKFELRNSGGSVASEFVGDARGCATILGDGAMDDCEVFDGSGKEWSSESIFGGIDEEGGARLPHRR